MRSWCGKFVYKVLNSNVEILFQHFFKCWKFMMVKPVHIFLVKSRVSTSCLMVELCLLRFMHFGCVLVYIFNFHHKRWAGDWEDFTFVKFISYMFSSSDDASVTALRWFARDTEHFYVYLFLYIYKYLYNIHIMQNFQEIP